MEELVEAQELGRTPSGLYSLTEAGDYDKGFSPDNFSEFVNVACQVFNSSHLMAHNLTDLCTNQVHLPKSFMVFVQVFYALVCILGLCGNTLVIYVVLRYSKMQTVTYIYILMLAVADEIFLLGLPFLIVTLSQKSWIFGLPMCKIYMTTTSINQVIAFPLCMRDWILSQQCAVRSVPHSQHSVLEIDFCKSSFFHIETKKMVYPKTTDARMPTINNVGIIK